VVTSLVPFTEGGHIILGRELVKQLNKHDYRAELVLTPQNPFGKQIGAYLANFNTVLTEAGDCKPIDGIISLRFPSYAVRHERHCCWLNHRMREYYDLWPQFKSRISWKGKIKESIRKFIIHRLDEFCLDHRVKKLYCLSETVRARLKAWGGHESEVLYPPAPEAEYRNEGYGDYIFAVSRLEYHKRMDLIVRAAAIHGIPCKIAGDGGDAQKLRDLAKELGVEDKVEFLGHISHEELLDHYARCRAVAFPTFNEDYGLITIEAFNSGKGVITLLDSGGPAEMVRDNATGLVTEPELEKFAFAMKMVMDDRDLAERFGQTAFEESKKHTWTNVIEKLVEW
jgi:glycosyltransferase involved in cell wall biosynthesis